MLFQDIPEIMGAILAAAVRMVQEPLRRPTWPLSRRTLMPWGWAAERVSKSLTIPSVSFPDRWSAFNTIETLMPGLMSIRFVLPIVLILSQV
jgi:hypothetical protein